MRCMRRSSPSKPPTSFAHSSPERDFVHELGRKCEAGGAMVGMTIDPGSPCFVPHEPARPNTAVAGAGLRAEHSPMFIDSALYQHRPATASARLRAQPATPWQPSAAAIEAAHSALLSEAGFSAAQKRLWQLLSEVKALTPRLSPADFRVASVHLSVLAGAAPPEPAIVNEERPLTAGRPGAVVRLPLTPRSPPIARARGRSPYAPSLTTSRPSTATDARPISPDAIATRHLAIQPAPPQPSFATRPLSPRPGSAVMQPAVTAKLAGGEPRTVADDGSAVGQWVANRLAALEQQVAELEETTQYSVHAQHGFAGGGLNPARLDGDPSLWDGNDVAEWLRLYAPR